MFEKVLSGAKKATTSLLKAVRSVHVEVEARIYLLTGS